LTHQDNGTNQIGMNGKIPLDWRLRRDSVGARLADRGRGFVVTLLACCMIFSAGAGIAHAQPRPVERLKNSLEVRFAFRPIIAEARRASVQILIDDKQVALGTVVDSDGYVLTKASELTGPAFCRLADGRKLAARIVGVERDLDLAMLRIDARGLPSVRWNDDAEPEVGRWLASVGPSEIPIAVGVVSAASRAVAPERGVLGVVISESRLGPRISNVLPESGAAKAGLKAGDIVKRIGEVTLENGRALAEAIGERFPGERVSLQVARDDAELVVQARLGIPVSELQDRSELEQQFSGEISIRRAGFSAVLEHDSVLQPAECGGPVVDLGGRVVGINIARAGRAESYAIPASRIARVLKDLRAGKFVAAGGD
jgi:serine protease Do